jgi:uncharacterized coiled-coil protein SlyX
MEEKQILQEKIEQCRRLTAAVTDALTVERLQAHMTELKERLAKAEDQSQFTPRSACNPNFAPKR